MPNNEAKEWVRIGEAVTRRAAALGIPTVSRLAEVSKGLDNSAKHEGVSDLTWSRLMRGVPVNRADKRQLICQTLGWTYDSIERMLMGEEPVSIQEEKQASRSSTARLAELEVRVKQLETRTSEIDAALADLIPRLLDERRK